jgi:hypothetical protein
MLTIARAHTYTHAYICIHTYTYTCMYKTDLDVRVPEALLGVKSHGAQPIEEFHRLSAPLELLERLDCVGIQKVTYILETA